MWRGRGGWWNPGGPGGAPRRGRGDWGEFGGAPGGGKKSFSPLGGCAFLWARVPRGGPGGLLPAAPPGLRHGSCPPVAVRPAALVQLQPVLVRGRILAV